MTQKWTQMFQPSRSSSISWISSLSNASKGILSATCRLLSLHPSVIGQHEACRQILTTCHCKWQNYAKFKCPKFASNSISQISIDDVYMWDLWQFWNPGCLWSPACQPKEIKWFAALCPCQFLEAGWTGKLRPTLLTPDIFHGFDII